MNEAVEKLSSTKNLIIFWLKKKKFSSDLEQRGLAVQKCHYPVDFKSIISVFIFDQVEIPIENMTSYSTPQSPEIP